MAEHIPNRFAQWSPSKTVRRVFFSQTRSSSLSIAFQKERTWMEQFRVNWGLQSTDMIPAREEYIMRQINSDLQVDPFGVDFFIVECDDGIAGGRRTVAISIVVPHCDEESVWFTTERHTYEEMLRCDYHNESEYPLTLVLAARINALFMVTDDEGWYRDAFFSQDFDGGHFVIMERLLVQIWCKSLGIGDNIATEISDIVQAKYKLMDKDKELKDRLKARAELFAKNMNKEAKKKWGEQGNSFDSNKMIKPIVRRRMAELYREYFTALFGNCLPRYGTVLEAIDRRDREYGILIQIANQCQETNM